MAKEFFKNLPDTSTPLNASRLNGLLNGNEAMGNIVVGDIKCKNLFNANLTTGYWNTDGTTTTTNTNIRTSEYIRVEPNKTYTFSSENNSISSFVGNLHFRDGNKNFISQIYEFDTFTTPENCHFITFHGSNTVYDLSLKIQLEEGTTATEYTSYKKFENSIWKQAIMNEENSTFTIPIRWADLKEISFRTLGNDLATFSYVTIPKEQWHNNGGYQVQTICFDTSGYYQGYANYKVSKKDIDHFIIHVTGTHRGAQIYYK